MKKSMLVVLAVIIATSLAACSSAAQEPHRDPEPIASKDPIINTEPVASTPEELTVADLTDEQTASFLMYATMYDEPIRLGNMSAEDAKKELDGHISGMVENGLLPSNGLELFYKWRDLAGIAFPEPEQQAVTVSGETPPTQSQPTDHGQEAQQPPQSKPQGHGQAAQQPPQSEPQGGDSNSMFAPGGSEESNKGLTEGGAGGGSFNDEAMGHGIIDDWN